jgi:hypothetical protein
VVAVRVVKVTSAESVVSFIATVVIALDVLKVAPFELVRVKVFIFEIPPELVIEPPLPALRVRL